MLIFTKHDIFLSQDAEFVGCFDQGRLQNKQIVNYLEDVKNTPEICIETCREQGFLLAGLLSGNICSCSS